MGFFAPRLQNTPARFAALKDGVPIPMGTLALISIAGGTIVRIALALMKFSALLSKLRPWHRRLILRVPVYMSHNFRATFRFVLIIAAVAMSLNRHATAANAVANTYPPVIQGGDIAGVSVDVAGNRYVTGNFQGTLDFDPTVGVDLKPPAGNSDCFVTRFNADGTYAWTQTFGGSASECHRTSKLTS